MIRSGFQSKPKALPRCKAPGCRVRFDPARPSQVACSPECAAAYATATRLKAERKEYRTKKLAAKPKSKWLKEAEAAVNRYVRLRDANLGCISCDKPATWRGQWHASHFRSVGAASAVRFNLWNIHKACSQCNHHLSGNIAAYTPALVVKIGQEKVDWLKAQTQVADYSVEYLARLKRIFNKRANRLAVRLGVSS